VGTLIGRPQHEVAEVIRKYGADFLGQYRQPAHHLRTLDALAKCRTAGLGGHVDACGSCGHQRISYNSCRNRHCPKCQGLNQQRWVEAREADLLPVPYYHVVFTLPDKLNGLCLSNPRQVYHLLFRAAWETVKIFAAAPKYLGAQTGMVSVLHTWGQNLSLHPHLHCIIPGGGLTPQGTWRYAKGKDKFLFPVKAMSKVFRAKFVQGLRQLYADQKLCFRGPIASLGSPPSFAALMRSLFVKRWVIYAKKPFAGPEQVVRYLGRYTHRIAISNHRIKAIKDGKVTFGWRDYRKNGKKSTMSLEANEFLRRFCLHILPPGFVRLRHYGLLASRTKTTALQQARSSLGVLPPPVPQKVEWKELLFNKTGIDLDACPNCETGRMKTIRTFLKARSPPKLPLSV